MGTQGRGLFCFLAVAMTATAQTPAMSVVSAASFARDGALAPEMIVSAYSPALTSAGTFTIAVRDSAGVERNAALLSSAAGQVSFVIPAGTAQGAATVTLARNGALAATASVRIARVSPGLFTANSSGEGAPAGAVLQAMLDGSRITADLFEQFSGQPRFEPRAFDLARADAETYLVLFGTGIRGAPLSAVSARLGEVTVPVQAAQAQGGLEGLDQVNIGPLPRELAGRRGLAELSLTVDGAAANKVMIAPTFPAAGAWGGRAELAEANSEMSVTALDGKIYVLGGYPASRNTVATVQVYDSLADAWSLTTPLPVAVNHSMPAVVNGKLYLIGGQTDPNVAYVNVVQEYDPAAREWRQRAAMPTQRSAGAAVVIDGKIYVAGGRPPRGADFAVYDPAKDEWTALPNLPTQRNHLAAVAIAGKMYVVGGRFEGGFQSPQSDAIEIYDPRTGAWTSGAPMPKPRGGVNAVEAYGCLHLFGGEFTSGVHPDHDVYNPLTNTWTSMPPMPTPVHGVTGAVFLDGLIYLPGGGTSQGGSSGGRQHQVYRPNQVCR
jgi:uncharacterized protein (TIGR03437 family)